MTYAFFSTGMMTAPERGSMRMDARTIFLACVFFTFCSQAAEPERPVNRFGLSYRAGFNVSAKFNNLGGFAPLSNPGPAASGANHSYDDGYNRVDSSGNTGAGACNNCTWYWGYENSSQISADGRFLFLNSSTAATDVEADADVDDPSHGAELTYQREFGKVGKLYWGLEAAFNWMSLTVEHDDDLRGDVTRLTDRYSLSTDGNPPIIPPAPPYRGSFGGPGAVISDIPIRSISRIPGAALLQGNYDFDADIYGFRLGPYIEWPFAEKWSALFSGGLALASINSDFSFDERTTIAGLGTQSSSGSDSDSDWNFGAYVSANIVFKATDNIDIFAGAQFQHLGDYTQEAGGKEAELDFGQSVFAVFGVGFSF